MKVIIHPCENVNGLTTAKYKVLPEARKSIIAPKNPETGRYWGYDELTEEEKDYIADVLYEKMFDREEKHPTSKEGKIIKYIDNFSLVLTDRPKELLIDSNMEHSIQYKLISKHRIIAPSKSEVNGRIHFYYIKNEEAEAMTKISGKKLVFKAASILDKTSQEDRFCLALLLGIPVKGISDAKITADLWEFSEKPSNAKKLVDAYEDPNKAIKIVVRGAIEMGIIYRETAGYVVKNLDGTKRLLGTQIEDLYTYYTAPEQQLEFMSIKQQLEDKGFLRPTLKTPTRGRNKE
jgi:hypothetical protein